MNGDYFIIVAKALLQKLNKQLGDEIKFEIFLVPNPLGVKVPEVLEVLLDQDQAAIKIYEELTDGKKRRLIFSIIKFKNVDLEVKKIIEFLHSQND